LSKQKSEKNSRYLALLADVHANLPALDIIMTYLKDQKIHNGIVLGDIVGYGPHPSECINILANSGFAIIKGNHDHAVVTGSFSKGFSKTGKWVIEWTIKNITNNDKHWLSKLPEFLNADSWLAVHGSPMDPTYFNGYVYEMTYKKNLDNLEKRNISLCFHGHTHIMGVYARKSGINDDFYTNETITLNQYDYSLVCPGAVGQARNGNPQCQFAIYDSQESKINFICLDYDIEKTIKDMKKLGFPESLQDRLISGR
jgi:predicted phosphodiesterase